MIQVRQIRCYPIVQKCSACCKWLARVLITFITYTRSPTSWSIPEVDLYLQRNIWEHAHVIQVRQIRCYPIVHKCRAYCNWLARVLIKFITYTRSPTSWIIPEVDLCLQRKVWEHAHVIQVRQIRCYPIVQKCSACCKWLARVLITFITYTRSPTS